MTDFFGGVVQAEIMPPLLDDSSAYSQPMPVGDIANSPEHVIVIEQGQAYLDSAAQEEYTSDFESAHVNAADFAAAFVAHTDQTEGMSRKMRAWASSLLVIALVGWVGTQRK